MPTKKRSATMKKRKPVSKKKNVTVANRRQASVAALKTNVAKKRRFSAMNLAMHLVIAGSAATVLLLLGVVESSTFSTAKSTAEGTLPVSIGLEYDSPLSVSAIFAKKENVGYLSFTNRSSKTIHVSFPSSWRRTEVSGAPIADFASEIPVFGFTRWTIPAYAGIKMLLPEAPSAVLFDSTSVHTAAIELSLVNLDTLSQSSRVVLLLKQALVPFLWESEE